MRRIVTATAAIAALAALGAAPAYASRPHPSASLAPKVHAQVKGFHIVHVPGLTRETLPRAAKGKVVRSGVWSGYVAVPKRGYTFKAVSANFTVPSVNCANSTDGTSGSASMTNWVGLDGYGNKTVEQTGEIAICQGGAIQGGGYLVFWENYPNAATTYCCTYPGDAIHVSVTFNSKTHLYQLYLIDYSQTGHYIQSESVACATSSVCKNASAEVIGEDLDGGPPGTDLADFGQTSFVNASVTSSNGKSGALSSSKYWTSVKMIMQVGKSLMAEPSSLEGGMAFYDTYYAPD
jgi:hypothetical protein